MSLKKLLSRTAALTANFDYRLGWTLTLEVATAEEIAAMLEKATRRTWKLHQQVEKVDDAVFARLLAENKIKGWRGLTYGVLAQMIPIPTDGLDLAEDIPFTADDAVIVMEKVPGLARWIMDQLLDVAAYRAVEAERLEKNYAGSPGSSPGSAATRASSASDPSPTA